MINEIRWIAVDRQALPGLLAEGVIPDNVEEDGLFEAARVSPTNLGLLLNARQAALELGFLTMPEFVSLTKSSFATINRLKKYRGHLYNWYDTQTLQPLSNSPFVSSVDSGNLVASGRFVATRAVREEIAPDVVHRVTR